MLIKISVASYSCKVRSMAAANNSKIKGFTLVELLVVISIIALLLSILMPSLQNARQQGQRVVCANNLKSIGLALMMYKGDYKDETPTVLWNPWMDRSNYWQGQLAPYLGWKGGADSGFAYATTKTREFTKYPDRLLKVFKCPSVRDSEKSRTIWGHSYGINHYLWSMAGDTAHPTRQMYWRTKELKRPRETFFVMDDTYYLIGDPTVAEMWPVHYKRTKNVLFADLHFTIGYQDRYEKLLPGIVGWYDYFTWGDTISSWATSW